MNISIRILHCVCNLFPLKHSNNGYPHLLETHYFEEIQRDSSNRLKRLIGDAQFLIQYIELFLEIDI